MVSVLIVFACFVCMVGLNIWQMFRLRELNKRLCEEITSKYQVRVNRAFANQGEAEHDWKAAVDMIHEIKERLKDIETKRPVMKIGRMVRYKDLDRAIEEIKCDEKDNEEVITIIAK